MRFHCEKSILLSAVTNASRAAAQRNAQPAIEGLLFTVENDITITGYNLEIGIVTTIEADIEQQGSVIMPTRMLLDILRKMPDEIISFTIDAQQIITILCGRIVFTLPGIAATEYPDMPTTEEERSFTFEQAVLRNMLARVNYAISDNESRFIITGSLFEITGQTLTIVALDGFRMALRRAEIAHDGEDFKFMVPGNALRDLEKILSEDSDSKLTVILGRRHIQFLLGQTTLISRLLEGEFHNYKRAIPEQYKYTITVNTRAFQAAVERVSLLVHDKIRSAIHLIFDENNIKLFCKTALGRANDECDCQGNGDCMEMGFNDRYLLDALRTIDNEEIQLCLTGNLSPCVILPVEDDDFLTMVLPTRLS